MTRNVVLYELMLPDGFASPVTASDCSTATPACSASNPLTCGFTRTADALPVEDLLPEDVCVPAVLGEFAQHVKIHPAQRERTAPVAVDHVVQPQR
jgi:hypothetical protein